MIEYIDRTAQLAFFSCNNNYFKHMNSSTAAASQPVFPGAPPGPFAATTQIDLSKVAAQAQAELTKVSRKPIANNDHISNRTLLKVVALNNGKRGQRVK